MPTIEIKSESASFLGFKYFWMKNVRGFDPSVHCARCLVGPYERSISVRMPVNAVISIAAADGDMLYLCGVSNPCRWERNLHLAVRVKRGSVAMVTAHTGDVISIADCESINFNDAPAMRLFPDLNKAFLTCRNFQFGAHLYGKKAIHEATGKPIRREL